MIRAKGSPLVSIIVLNYQGGLVTENCLRTVLKTNYPSFEIILVDNGSPPDEIKRLQKKYSHKISIILAGTNLGYAGGNNLGAANAKGKYLVFLNNDTLVTPDWLSSSIKKMEADTKIAFLQPKINWSIHRKYFEYCGGCGGFIDYFGFPFTRGRIFGSIEEDVNQYEDEREIFWATGAALFCRSSIFKKLGGFDPYFFAQAEDEDINFRALRAGYKNIYFPKSQIFHLGSFTGNRNRYNKTFYNYRNHLVMLIKNLSVKELIIVLPFKLLFDGLASWYYLVKFRSFKMFRAVWGAYFFLLFDLPEVIQKRFSFRLNYGYPKNGNLVYKGSIIFQHYILKRKRWGDIFGHKSCQSKIIDTF